MEAGDRISFQEVLKALGRRWYLLLAAPAVLVAAVSAVTLSKPRDYEATAVMLVGISELKDSNGEGSVPMDMMRTIVKLIPGLLPPEELKRKFKLSAEPYNVSADELWSDVLEARVVKDTRLIHLSATTPDPALSRDIANYVAERAMNLYLNYSRTEVVRTKKYLKNQVDGAKRRLNNAEDALLRFNKKSRLDELSQDIKTLLLRRSQLDFLRFQNRLRLKGSERDDLSREKEEVLKLLGDDAEFPELKMAMDKNDSLLERHRALSKKMLEMKSRLPAMLSATSGDSRGDALSSARRKSMENAGAGDVIQAVSELEKIRSEKRSLEDERKELSTSLPVLTVEIQVSMSRLKSLETAMNDFGNASRAGTFSTDGRTLSDAPRKNGGGNNERASGAPFDAVSMKIVDEESRLTGLKEKKKRHLERIARIDAKLPEVSGKLLELEARRLLLEISRMSDEIKKIESEILSNRREIAERRGRRIRLLARLDALRDAPSLIGELSVPFFPAPVSVRVDAFNRPKQDDLSQLRSEISENILSDKLSNRLRILDRDILTTEHLRHREKLFSVERKAVDEELNKKITEEANLISLGEKLKLEHSLSRASYSTASDRYDAAETFVLSGDVNMKIANRARMPPRPTPRYLTIKASLSLIVGLFLALCAVLFLEFRETPAARREPDGA